MQEIEQYVGEKKFDQLEVVVYPASSGTYNFYEDDGISYDYRNGKYSITEFSSQVLRNSIVINTDKKYDGFDAGRKYYLFKILNTSNIAGITNNGSVLKTYSNENELNASSGGYYLDPDKNVLFVKVKNERNIKIEYKL
jgi:alpha-glucosidase (family GH31 glycosyl hydrolase)